MQISTASFPNLYFSEDDSHIVGNKLLGRYPFILS